MDRRHVCEAAAIAAALSTGGAAIGKQRAAADPKPVGPPAELPAPASEPPAPVLKRSAPGAIERAKAAGIRIDPAAEAIMRRAPAGSCMSDPLRPGCPKVREIDVSASNQQIGIISGTMTGASVIGAASASVRARAAQWVDLCYLEAEPPERYNTASQGYKMRGLSRSTCAGSIVVQELLSTLQRYQSGAWTALANGPFARGAGGIQYTSSATYNCNHQSLYSYRTEGFLYAFNGQSAAVGTDYDYANWTCPS